MSGRVIGIGVLVAALAMLLVMLGLGEEDAAPRPEEAQEVLREEARTPPPAAPMLQGTAKAVPEAGRAPAPVSVPGRTGGELVSYHGEVQDESGTRVAGAAVLAVHEGRELLRTTSAADGTFRFELRVVDRDRQEYGTVVARSGDGRAATQTLVLVQPRPAKPLGTDRYVGVLLLRVAYDLEVRIGGSCGSGREARVYVGEARFGIHSTIVESPTTDGALRIEALPPGPYRVAAYAEGCGRAAVDVILPREAKGPLVLELGASHALRVRVIERGTEKPIAGARVEVAESIRRPDFHTHGALYTHPSELVTDASGEVMIEGLAGTEALYLAATAEGYPERSSRRTEGPGTARATPGAEEVTLELTAPRTVRWLIEPGRAPVPPDGTVLKIVPWSNTGRTWVPPEGVMEDGHLVIHGWGAGYASGYAHAPDGSIARLQAAPDAADGHPTSFHPLRTIDVSLRFEDGRPAAGWPIHVLDGGNNEVQPPVPTDAEGKARMSGLYSGAGTLVTVQAQEPGDRTWYRTNLGSVNLHQQDGRFEGTIPLKREFRVYFRVDGKARLPETPYSLMISHRPALIEEADPERGCVVVRYRHHALEGAAHVAVRRTGYRSEGRRVTLGGVDEVVEVTLDLTRAGSLRVRVSSPGDDRYQTMVQRWAEANEAWLPAMGGDRHQFYGSGRRADANGIVHFRDLEPGRYRAMDQTSGLTSAAVDVVAADEPAEVALDLSKTGWVKGRVEVPEGIDPRTVRAGIRGGSQRGLGKEGELWVRVPGTREVVIEVSHPMLVPAEGDGTLRVTAPRDGIVFRLVEGRKATLRFDPPLHQFVNRGSPAALQVFLYRGAVGGEPVLETNGTLDGNGQDFTFGGYEPGTWTVWIDARPRAPLVLEGVTLGDGTTELGTAAAPEGSTLKVRLLAKEGQTAPSYDVFLTKLDEPTYQRRGGAHGSVEARVTGIGRGRFRVRGFSITAGGTTLDEEIEFDGASTTVVERTVDLR